MKKAITFFMSLFLMVSILGACMPKDDVITEAIIPEGFTEYSVKQTSGKFTEGYGAQIDTHMFRSYNNLSDEELDIYLQRALDMNLQNIRTQVFPEWYERDNDNSDYNQFDYNSPNVDMNSAEMLELWKLLDFCQANGILVDLSFYGCNTLFESQDKLIKGTWLGAPFTNNWITAPKLVDEKGSAFPGLEEYAETVYALLNYTLNVKKYTCVNEFSIYPEPNLSYVLADGKVSHSGFVNLCKKVDEKLKKEGIRNKIAFSGPASAMNTIAEYSMYVEDLGNVFDKFTASTYKYDENDSNESFFDFGTGLSDVVSATSKSVGIAEFGSKNYIDPANQKDIDSYGRALYLGRYMINLTNAGVTNMKYWVLGDVMYGSYLMRLGLWHYRDNNFAARPQYYTWSLICKYTNVGSEIFPVESNDKDIAMTAIRLPDGNWSYIVCNTSSMDYKISMVNYNKAYPKSMNIYEVRESLCDGVAVPISSSGIIQISDGAINYKLKSNSFVIFSTK